MNLLYEENTQILRRCFFEVQNEVGLGRQEHAYHQACKIWFEERRLPVLSKPPLRLFLDRAEAYAIFPDFVAWDSITVELKALPRKLGTAEFVQLFDYLKFRRDRLGLLVNMGLDRVFVERIIYDPPEARLAEDWSCWNHEISGLDREAGLAVRDVLRSIYEQHGTGYGEEIVEKLVLFALVRRGLPIRVRPPLKAYYRQIEVDESPLDCIVVADRIVLAVTALFDDNNFNMNRGRSYMKALDLPWGVAANFGKKEAQIVGLRRKK